MPFHTPSEKKKNIKKIKSGQKKSVKAGTKKKGKKK